MLLRRVLDNTRSVASRGCIASVDLPNGNVHTVVTPLK